MARSNHRRCFLKKAFLKIFQNSSENTCVGISFLTKLQARFATLLKKETLTQVFSCEIILFSLKFQAYSLMLYINRDSDTCVFL